MMFGIYETMPVDKKGAPKRFRAKPWLAPLIVTPEMEERLERGWETLNTSMGSPVPKTTFVRMLLERGLRAIEDGDAMMVPRKKLRGRS
jgi:hypothetical protein